MKNLKPFDGNILDYYNNLISEKQSKDAKSKFAALSYSMELNFNNYGIHFFCDDLQSLIPDMAAKSEKKVLTELYNYRSASIRQLKVDIAKLQPQTYRYTCQHCTLTGIESFDHFVPKDEFPEFSIHPLNLIPSCIKCNQHKGKYWRLDGKRTALNLYIDKLPEQQYLFVEIIKDEFDELDFNFILQNRGGIETGLFHKLEDHFKTRNLFIRMREKSIPVITELTNTVRMRIGNSPIEVVKKEIIATAEENKKSFGLNYWKSIVEIALIDAPIFLAMIDLEL
jgi:hypothetical protein